MTFKDLLPARILVFCLAMVPTSFVMGCGANGWFGIFTFLVSMFVSINMVAFVTNRLKEEKEAAENLSKE